METDAAGRVVAVHVATGSGYPRLDAAAPDAAFASRCAAQVDNSAPSPMRARVPITFNLDESTDLATSSAMGASPTSREREMRCCACNIGRSRTVFDPGACYSASY
ncbi:TPA: energy transducer TonB [Burkholderia cenocepacia]|nr:energy transducer TonB [Burkholderia cenocepacia]HEP6432913.1 energy transducer TonB [Burkholderia cenocepacia]